MSDAASVHEDKFVVYRAGEMATAIGLARLALQHRDPARAADFLDDCVDEMHRLHWDALLADGHDAVKIDLLLGSRESRAKRSWNG